MENQILYLLSIYDLPPHLVYVKILLGFLLLIGLGALAAIVGYILMLVETR